MQHSRPKEGKGGANGASALVRKKYCEFRRHHKNKNVVFYFRVYDVSINRNKQR